MRDGQHQNNELTLDVWLMPDFETAVRVWQDARRLFLREGDGENLDRLCAAANQPYLAFCQLAAEDPWAPDTFRQFKQMLSERE
jgi:hypothetical protein